MYSNTRRKTRMLWLLLLLTSVLTWIVLRYWHEPPRVNVIQVTEEVEPEKLKSVSREEGLRLLGELIDRKPIPENCEDVMYFLREFEKHKGVWGVTGQDLRSIYMSKCSWSQLLRQWSMTRSCCPDYASYIN